MIRMLTLLFLLVCGTGGRAQNFAPRLNFGAKFEVDDKVLHGVGQSEEIALAGYVDALPRSQFPRIYMAYIPSKADEARVQRTLKPLRDMARYYPDDLAFQVGISMTTGSAVSGNQPYTEDIVAGVYDENIDRIARGLDSLGHDIFVRIGYEANGFWNAYEPASYVPAFRYVADRMRAVSDRIAIVWCTHPIDGLDRQLQYYPGDDYVDWWAIDLFQPRFFNQALDDFLTEAETRGFPVMIGESTPTKIGVGKGQESWDAWYRDYFQLIRDHGVIKAFCYINRDWAYASSLTDWGNSLIQTDARVLDNYRAEMESHLYLHIPLEENHLTAIRTATNNVGENGSFTVGVRGSDTLRGELRFNLDTLMLDSLLGVKLWLSGRNDSGQDHPISIYSSGQPMGNINVNDRGRDKVYWVDVTRAAREAQAAGRGELSFTFGLPQRDAKLFTFHAPGREDGYPPALQIVYNETGDSSVTDSTTTAIRSPHSAPAIDFSISPNPTDSQIELRTAAAAAYQVSVMDAQGRTVLHREGLGGNARLRVGDLPQGTYFVWVLTKDGGRGVRRFVRR